jgi:thymidylate synthase
LLIARDNFPAAWFALLGKLYEEGRPVSPRGYETHELLGVQVRVHDLRRNILVHPTRALSYRFMIAEWLWMAAGREDVATIARYNKQIAQFSDDGVKFAGAYGPQMLRQIPWAMQQLQEKPGCRQAVIQIWHPTPAPSKDIPCTLSWQLLARDGRLNAVITMRSSDIWLGLPYDFVNLSQLVSGIAGELGLETGELIFNLGSSHLYDRDREKASAVLAQPGLLERVTSPQLPGRPPADDILDSDTVALAEPWATYRDVLQSKTQAEALGYLRALEER